MEVVTDNDETETKSGKREKSRQKHKRKNNHGDKRNECGHSEKKHSEKLVKTKPVYESSSRMFLDEKLRLAREKSDKTGAQVHMDFVDLKRGKKRRKDKHDISESEISLSSPGKVDDSKLKERQRLKKKKHKKLSANSGDLSSDEKRDNEELVLKEVKHRQKHKRQISLSEMSSGACGVTSVDGRVNTETVPVILQSKKKKREQKCVLTETFENTCDSNSATDDIPSIDLDCHSKKKKKNKGFKVNDHVTDTSKNKYARFLISPDQGAQLESSAHKKKKKKQYKETDHVTETLKNELNCKSVIDEGSQSESGAPQKKKKKKKHKRKLSESSEEFEVGSAGNESKSDQDGLGKKKKKNQYEESDHVAKTSKNEQTRYSVSVDEGFQLESSAKKKKNKHKENVEEVEVEVGSEGNKSKSLHYGEGFHEEDVCVRKKRKKKDRDNAELISDEPKKKKKKVGFKSDVDASFVHGCAHSVTEMVTCHLKESRGDAGMAESCSNIPRKMPDDTGSAAKDRDAVLGDKIAGKMSHRRRENPPLTLFEAAESLGLKWKNTVDTHYWMSFRNLLLEKGFHVRTGRWSAKEDEILTKNWNEQIKALGIESRDIVQERNLRHGNGHTELGKLVQESQLWIKLVTGLNRLPYSCYNRAKHLFDPQHQSVKLTEEQEHDVLRMLEVTGGRWYKFSRDFGYSARSLSLYFLAKNSLVVNSSPFTTEEDNAIIKGVQKATGREDVRNIFEHLPWKEISKEGILLKNRRTNKQLRERWLHHISWNINKPETERKPFTSDDKVKLIKMIYKSDAYEENEFDFCHVYHEFDSVPSPAVLRHYWFMLTTAVPDFKWKTFTDIIEYLHDVYLPKLGCSDDQIATFDDDDDDDDDDERMNESSAKI